MTKQELIATVEKLIQTPSTKDFASLEDWVTEGDTDDMTPQEIALEWDELPAMETDFMDLTDRFPQKTIDRKVGVAQNKIRHQQLNEICKKIARIEFNRDFDDDIEKQIELLALKSIKATQLKAWKIFRTKLGLSNELLRTV